MKKLKIGLYSAGLRAYWAQFEGLRDRIAGYNRFTIGIPGGIELLLGIDPESGSLSARSKEEWGSTESVLWFLREVPPETAENP